MLKLSPKKNIIYFSIDGRRKDLYGTFGGAFPTPNLDRLAGKSIVFNKMYSAATSTVMSLNSIINGRYAHEMSDSVYDPLAKKVVFHDNLFEEMKRQGRKNIIFIDQYLKDGYFPSIFSGFDAEVVTAPKYAPSTEYARKIIDVIKDESEPFFAFFHFVANVKPPVSKENPDTLRKLERLIREDDNAIGLLLEHVNLDDTTIVFTSDHGNMQGEHKLYSHAFFLYEPLVRVPCLISSDEKIVVDDLYSQTQLRDLLTGVEVNPSQAVYADTQYKMQPHRITMVVEGDFKYMAHYSPHTAVSGCQEELYDLKIDPGENRNLLHDVSKHPLLDTWNKKNMPTSVYYHEYEEVMLTVIIENLRKKVADIWRKDLEEILVAEGEKNTEQIIANMRTLSSFDQLALVSEFMSGVNQKVWYQGPKPENWQELQPPFNYPGLPKSFREASL